MESSRIHTKHGALSANELLLRAPDAHYIEEWTHLLAKEESVSFKVNDSALVLFRLGEEWFAIKAALLREICSVRPIHSLPHRKEGLIKGLINLKGQLQIAVNLHHLLEIESAPTNKPCTHLIYQRMIALQQGGHVWLFLADEVFGVMHFDLAEMENVPVTVFKSRVNYAKGVIPWNEINAIILDEELLFSTLQRAMQ